MKTPDNKALKARAHHLKPVVTIGAAGLTDAVMREIDVALTAHELIKIRAAADDRSQRRGMADSIASTLDARFVHGIGHVLVFYRPRPEQPAGQT